MDKLSVFNRLADCGIVAVIRAQSESQLRHITAALLEGGVVGIEVTMTTPNAISGIANLVREFGERAVVGVGTVLDPQTCESAIQAGAEFVVSPALIPSVIEITRRLGKVSIPGAYSPTEIFAAWSAGADVVKIFPATTLGPGYLRDLLAPMPFLKLTPTGGVDLKTAADWIRAGAVMLGAGSSLVSKDALNKGDWAAITSTARQFVEVVKAARAGPK
jgi:2-dehydro-3-deoxyphosphogluconate aldolase/(4S)-4-hydroxy-2-oxoglutarate aldolase